MNVRRLCAVALFSLLPFAAVSRLCAQVTATAPVTVQPQYAERWDVYAGAAYSHFNPSPGGAVHATNLEGFDASGTLWFRQSVGIESSVRGYYGHITEPPNFYNLTTTPMHEYLFLFGPNFRLIRRDKLAAGMHFLIGAADGSFDNGFPHGIQPQTLNIFNDKLAFGAGAGPWLDYNLNSRWSVRFISDWQPTHYGFSTQQEFAGSVGVVYKFGTRLK